MASRGRIKRAARLAELEHLQVGVTGAAGGIAESGTVVLVSDRDGRASRRYCRQFT